MAKLTNENLIGALMGVYGWSREETINGYGFFEDEFGAVEVCRIDDLFWCDDFDYGIETDEDACVQAEKDGVKFINDIEGLDKRRYIDTPKNRMLCEEYVRNKYDGMTIHCPYCGEKIVVEFDTAKCEECEWSAIETDLYEIMDC